MVIVGDVVVDELLAVVDGLTDEELAGLRVVGRHAHLREFEVVAAIVRAALGMTLGLHVATLPLGDRHADVVQRRGAEADRFHVGGPAELVGAVHVDVRDRLGERVERVLRVIARAEQALLLRGDGQEQDAAPHALGGRQRLEGLCELEEHGGAGGVVGRAIVDLITLQLRVAAEMIPMGRVDHVFGAQLRVGAGEERDDILRGDVADGVVDDERRLRVERDRLEIAAGGGLFQRLKIPAAGGEQAFRGLNGEPALNGDAAGITVGAAQVEVFPALAGDDDAKRIGGRAGFVNDEAGGGSLLGGNVVFVGPAAVVGHGRAAEDFRVELARRRIDHRRVVDEHDDGLAAHVDALEVIPAEFGCDHPVTDKHEVAGLDLDMRRHAKRRAHIVVDCFHRHGLAGGGEGGVGLRGDADERDILDVGAVRIAGLEAEFAEFVFEVGDGLDLASRTRGAALELVRGEDLGPREQARGGN